jgi:CHAD domain-containing protein
MGVRGTHGSDGAARPSRDPLAVAGPDAPAGAAPLAGAGPWAGPGPFAGPGGRGAARVVTAALERSVARFSEHATRLLDTVDDEDAVHEARVALRRLRSDLRTFRPLFDASFADGLHLEAREPAAVLGAARDADVLLGRLRRGCAALPPDDEPAGRRLLAVAASDRARALAALEQWLHGEAFAAFVATLERAVQAPRFAPGAEAVAASDLVALVVRPWKRLRREAGRLGADAGDEELHALRIRAKRCRYALEAVAPVLGAPARRLARALAGLQDVLGELHDAVVAGAWLRAVVAAPEPAYGSFVVGPDGPALRGVPAASQRADEAWGLPPDAAQAFVAGELVAAERRAAERARKRWPRAWARASRHAVAGFLDQRAGGHGRVG